MLMGDLYHLLRIYRYKSSTKPGRAKKALQEHQEIVAAIARRDPAGAEQKMREHLRNARLYVEEQLAAEAAAADAPQPDAVARRPGRGAAALVRPPGPRLDAVDGGLIAGQGGEPVIPVQGDEAAGDGQQPLAPQLLQGAIDVHHA
jgi:hypothetical protein